MKFRLRDLIGFAFCWFVIGFFGAWTFCDAGWLP